MLHFATPEEKPGPCASLGYSRGVVKRWTYVGLVGLTLGLNGCGGSAKGIADEASGTGLALTVYRATLPDGAPMMIDFVAEKNGVYAGSFAVAAVEGELAHQTGSFQATLSGGRLTADCTTVDGETFQLTGAANGTDGLRLSRSDIASPPLAFAPVPAAPPSRGTVAFYLDGLSGTKGTVSLSDVPNSTQVSGSTTMREYKGTWQGVPVTFWSYSSGVASVVVYLDPLCVMSATFGSYLLSDFPTKTATASSGYMTMYNSTLRTQLKFKTLPQVSPPR
jgi:hypothetical protein